MIIKIQNSKWVCKSVKLGLNSIKSDEHILNDICLMLYVVYRFFCGELNIYKHLNFIL